MSSKRKLRPQVSLDMQEEDSKRLTDFLRCVACSDLAEDAVETDCCNSLLCSVCFEKQKPKCPKCQAACSATASHLARRLIGYQPWQCGSCGKETTRSERADHNLICPQQVRQCPAAGCTFLGVAADFVLHLTEAHADQLLKNAELLFPRLTKGRRLSLGSSDSSDELEEDSEEEDSNSSNEPSRLSHMLGLRRARQRRRIAIDFNDLDASRTDVSVTGKNYCEGRLNGPRCFCCDGRCGPSNGCNCVNCMRMDLVTFNVTTPRALVNREGVVSRISSETGKFYCGRRVMRHDPFTDGYCGPDNGNNCHACRTLDDQIGHRYREIAAEWDELPTEEHGIENARDSLELAMGYDTVDAGLVELSPDVVD